MIRKTHIIVMSSLTLIVTLFLYSNKFELYAEGKLPMPKGLEGIYLGMSLGEFKKVKPNIKKDDWPYSPLYFEKNLNNEFFSSVIYKFSDDKLSDITLGASGDFNQDKMLGLINGCIKKWGKNYIKKIGIGEDIKTKATKSYPVFYWERTDAKILVTYSTKRFTIQILDPNLRPSIKFKESSDIKELEEAFKDVLNAESFMGRIFE